jgi:hypothetical protein
MMPAFWSFDLVAFDDFFPPLYIVSILALLTLKFNTATSPRPRPPANGNVSALTAVSIDTPHALFAIDTNVHMHVIAGVALIKIVKRPGFTQIIVCDPKVNASGVHIHHPHAVPQQWRELLVAVRAGAVQTLERVPLHAKNGIHHIQHPPLRESSVGPLVRS